MESDSVKAKFVHHRFSWDTHIPLQHRFNLHEAVSKLTTKSDFCAIAVSNFVKLRVVMNKIRIHVLRNRDVCLKIEIIIDRVRRQIDVFAHSHISHDY